MQREWEERRGKGEGSERLQETGKWRVREVSQGGWKVINGVIP